MIKFREKLLASILVVSIFANSVVSVTFADEMTPSVTVEDTSSSSESYESSDEATNGLVDTTTDNEPTQIEVTDIEENGALENTEGLEKSETDESQTGDLIDLETEENLNESENSESVDNSESLKSVRQITGSPTTFSGINALLTANPTETEFSFTGNITVDETIYMDRNLTFDFNNGTITVNDAKVLFENANTNKGYSLTVKNANFVSTAPADTRILVFNTLYTDPQRNSHLTVENSNFTGFKRKSFIADKWRHQIFNNCEFTGNSADALGLSYIYMEESWSGNVDLSGTAGKIEINNCNVHDNEIGKYGLFSPGIRYAGVLIVKDSTFENNTTNEDYHNEPLLLDNGTVQNINNIFNIVSRGWNHTKVDISNTKFINNAVSGTVINVLQESDTDVALAYSWFLDSYGDVKISSNCEFTGNSSTKKTPAKINLDGMTDKNGKYNGYATMYSKYKDNIGKKDVNGNPVMDKPIEGGTYQYLYNNVDMRFPPMNVVKFEPIDGKPTLDVADQYILSNGKITLPIIKSNGVQYHIGQEVPIGDKKYVLLGLGKAYSNQTDIEIPQDEIVAWDFDNDTTADWSTPGFEHGEAIVLVPMWSEAVTEVEFIANNGNLANPTPDSAFSGGLIDEPAGFPTEYDGKFFYGWNTKSDGTGDYWDFTKDKITNVDMQLYGIWIDISPREFEAMVTDTLATTIDLNTDLFAKFGFGNPFSVTSDDVSGQFGWGSNNENTQFGTVGQKNYTLTFKTDEFGGTYNFDVKVNVKGNLNNATVTINPKPYNGQLQTISASDITVVDNGVTLIEGVDYTFSTPVDANMFDAGTTVVTINGIGNYGGSKTADYVITKINPTVTANTNPKVDKGTTFDDYLNLIKGNGTLTATGVAREISSVPGTFSWKTATGTSEITAGNQVLVFTPSNASTATNGTHIGNYNVKEITLNFEINQTSLSADMITSMEDVPYKGESYASKKPVLKDGSYTLIEGVDYTITANPTNDYINVGNVQYTINGIGAYKGSIPTDFDITKVNPTVADVEATSIPTSWTYKNLIDDLIAKNKLEAIGVTADGELLGGTFTITSGEALTDLVEITEGKTITVLFTPSTTDSRNYNTQTATITLKDFNIPTILVAPLSDVVYNGYEQKQNPVVTVVGGATVPSAFYDVTYSSDVLNVGTVTVTVTGKERVQGEVSVTYKITKATPTVQNVEATSIPTFWTYQDLINDLVANNKLEAMGVTPDGKLSGGTFTITSGGLATDLVDVTVGKTITVLFTPSTTDSQNYNTQTATITLKDFDKPTIQVASLSDVVYNGLEQKQNPVVTLSDGTSVASEFYDVSYSLDVVNVGDVTVTVTGKGRVQGQVSVTYKITKATPTVEDFDATFIPTSWTYQDLIDDLVFNNELEAIGVTKDGKLLDGTFTIVSGGLATDVVDQTVANKQITVLFTPSTTDGRNYNTQTAIVTLKSFSDLEIEVSPLDDTVYNGKSQKKIPVVTYGRATVPSNGYTLEYSEDTTNVGLVTVKVRGKGVYVGNKEVTYNITKATPTVSDVQANDVKTSWTYKDLLNDLIANNKLEAIGVTEDGKLTGGTFTITSGESETDLVEITNDKTITVLFTPSVTDGRNYNTQTATITLKDFDIPTIQVAKLNDVVYNGLEQKQNPVVTVAGGATVPAQFYDVSYSKDLVNANTVTVTVTGKERVQGEVTVTYKITKATPTVANIEVEKSKSTNTYKSLLEELAGTGQIVAMGVEKDGQLSAGYYRILKESLIDELLFTNSADNEFEVEFTPHQSDAHNYQLTVFTIKINSLEAVEIDEYKVNGLSDVVYNALEQKQTPVVIDDLGNRLVINKDFTVSYDTEDFVNCKKIIVTITGIDRYTGSITKEYSITKANTKVIDFVAEDVISTWTNSNLLAHLVQNEKIVALGLIESNPTLKDGKFELRYADETVKNNNKFEIVFIPSDKDSVNYNNTVATIQIKNTANPDISNKDMIDISTIDDVTFDGKTHQYEPVLKDKAGNTLVKDTDYTLTYNVSDFINAGKITITVQGINKYTGKVNVSYNILKDVVNPTFDVTEGFTLSGNAIVDKISGTSFTYNTNKPLATGDVTVTYDNKKGTSGTLEVTSLENGVANIEWKPFLAYGVYEIKASYKGDRNYIEPSDEVLEYIIKSDAQFAFGVSGVVSPMLYTGSAITQDNLKVIDVYTGETLTKGTDYTLTYQNNVNVGTASIIITGIGNYTNSITVTFEIIDKPITDGQQWFKLSGIISPKVYTGSAITQKDAIVTDVKSGKVLTEGVDYTLSYINNIEVGTADIIATGIAGSKYESSVASSKFAIVKDDLVISDKIFVVDGIVSPKAYTGEEVTQDSLVVKDGNGKTLVEGVDYKISYLDNIEVGTAIVVVTGIGEYENIEVTGTFEIVPNDADYFFIVEGILSPMHYTGKEVYQDTLTVIDIYTGEILTENVDYTVSYKDNIAVGQATVVVTGIGKYSGDTLRYFNIIKVPFMAFRVSGVRSPLRYTGDEIEQENLQVRDYYNGRLLDPSEYDVYYDNNVDVTSGISGPATVRVVGKARYEEAPPAIRPFAIFDVNSVAFNYRVEDVKSPLYYTGEEVTQEKYIKVYDENTNTLLEYGKDYTLAYLNNIEVGTATVAVIAKDTLGYGYEGIITIETFDIIEDDTVYDLTVSGIESPKVYTGLEIKQPNMVVTDTNTGAVLVEGTDYTVNYTHNIEVGPATVTVNGIGAYEGITIVKPFTIIARDVQHYFGVSGIIDPMYYTGSEIKQNALKVYDVYEGTILKENVDYTLSYKNNVEVGVATVTVTGIGNYKGSLDFDYNIIDKKVDVNAKIFKVSGVISPKMHTGSAITQNIVVTDALTGKVLTENVDYTISYKDNINVGRATVVVTGINDYKDQISTNYFAIIDNDLIPTIDNKVIVDFIVDGVESPKDYTGFEVLQENIVVKVEVLDEATGEKSIIELVENKDFVLTYEDNINPGTATVIITGIGEYEDIVITQTYEIIPKNATRFFDVTGIVSPKYYTGSEIYQQLVVRDKETNELLVENEHYIIKYNNNIEVGTATIDIIGIGVYGDIVEKSFIIKKEDSIVTPTYPDTPGGGGVTPHKPNRDKVVEEIEQIALYEAPYIFGYEDDTFRAESNITRAEVAQILYNIDNVRNQDTSNIPYSDVESNKWYAEAIAYCNKTNKMVGYEDGTFRPDDYITRAELIKAIYGIRNLDDTGINTDLTDIEGHWAYDMIKKAYSNDVIKGYPDKSFKPNADITRAETVSVVNKMLLRPDEWVLNREYVDLDKNHWNYNSIMNASNGVKLESKK